jgi:hypothetical protein
MRSLFGFTHPALLAIGLAASAPSLAQDSVLEQWGFDPTVLVSSGQDLLSRAPDEAVDGLFQRLHATAKRPEESQALCALFDPQADRSLDGLNALASQLGEESRVRFADAVAQFVVAAAQNPPQPYDAAAARQSLKAAGVRAALLDDGFVAGLNGDDHPARCRSIGLLLDAVQSRPPGERAAVTRLMLAEGLDRLALASGAKR